MWRRILAVIRKEFIQMRRDRLTMATMLGIPLIQLTLFGYAINTDVKHIPMGVVDYSHTTESRLLIASFTESHYFDLVLNADNPDALTDAIDRGNIKVGVVIDPDFETDIRLRRPARVQVLVDASDPQVATSTLANAQGIGQARSMELMLQNLRPGTSYGANGMPVDVQIRAWFNPDLVSANYIVPGLIGVILTMTMMMITAMAIVRERETGTMEQLVTTPVRPLELMVGKIVPYVVVGYVQVTVALLVGVLLFKVPIRGSLVLLYALCMLQIVGYLGLGLLVSTIARSQQQAMQMSFLMFLPTMLLSGFMFPREGMPQLAQKLGLILPLTYFLQILRGIILKGVGITYLFRYIWPMLLLLVGIYTLALLRFGKRGI